MSRYVIVSYSRQDRPFVDRMVADLRAYGVKIWQDTEQIPPGGEWGAAVQAAMEGASAMLLVASAASFRSQVIRQELRYFQEKKRVVIPVVLDDVGAKNLPLGLRTADFADFREDYDQTLHRLVSVLAEFLLTLGPEPPDSQPPVTPPAQRSKGYVFISYAEEDAEFAQDLRRYLAGKGYAYWDYAESDRDFHSQLSLELEGVIREAVATLTVLSPAWKSSQWAAKEFLFSQEVGTPVFLLRVHDPGPTLATAGVPYIDFVRDRNDGFQRLDRELKRRLI